MHAASGSRTTVDTSVESTRTCKKKCCDKHPAYYICQIVGIFLVIIVCAINLTISREGKLELWAALMSVSLGYLLPQPKLRKKHKEAPAAAAPGAAPVKVTEVTE